MVDRLSKQEQETIINFNREEDKAYIFTYEKKWQRHLEGKLGLKPVNENGKGGNEYEVDKCCVRLPRKKRRYSEESKKRLAERFSKSHSEVRKGSSSGEI